MTRILKIFHDILAACKTLHAERSCMYQDMRLHKIYGENLSVLIVQGKSKAKGQIWMSPQQTRIINFFLKVKVYPPM